MKKYLTVLLLSSLTFVANFALSHTCADNSTRILNPAGGLVSDGSDGVTLYLDAVGHMQVFADGFTDGQIYASYYCPAIGAGTDGYGTFVTVSNGSANVTQGDIGSTLEPVSQSPITGTGTIIDPWTVTTVVRLKANGTFAGGTPELFTFIDTVSVGNPSSGRTIIAENLNPALTYRFTHYFDSWFNGGDNAAGFTAGSIPASPLMPTMVGAVKLGQHMAVTWNSNMPPWTSFFTGSFSVGNAETMDSLSDLSNTVDTNPSTDNGFGVQWKVTGKTNFTIPSLVLSFAPTNYSTDISFSDTTIALGGTTTANLDTTSLVGSQSLTSLAVNLAPGLTPMAGTAMSNCGVINTMKTSTGGNGWNAVTLSSTAGLNYAANTSCNVNFKVKATQPIAANSIAATWQTAIAHLTVLSGPMATKSIPSLNWFAMLLLAFGLMLIVKFVLRKRHI